MSQAASAYELLPKAEPLRVKAEEVSSFSHDEDAIKHTKDLPTGRDTVNIEDWPTDSSPSKRSARSLFSGLLLDVAFALIPAIFLVYAAYARRSNDLRVDAYPKRLHTLQQVGNYVGRLATLSTTALTRSRVPTFSA